MTAESDLQCGQTNSLMRSSLLATQRMFQYTCELASLLTSAPRQAHLKTKLNEKEAELMKGVQGWEVGASVYQSTYVKPMELLAVPNSQKSIFKAHF